MLKEIITVLILFFSIILNFKGNWYTFREATLSQLFLSLSENGSILKVKIFLPEFASPGKQKKTKKKKTHTQKKTTTDYLYLEFSEKRFALRGKNLFPGLPQGNKFFPFRANLFSEGVLCTERQTGSHKNFSPLYKIQRLYKVYLVPCFTKI